MFIILQIISLNFEISNNRIQLFIMRVLTNFEFFKFIT